MGALALGAMLLGVSAYAAPRDGAAVEKQARNTALRTIAGSDAVLRDAVSGNAAAGCITFSTIIRQNAGGVTACNVTSGGGSGAVTVSGNDCDIVFDSFISNWACVGAGAAGRLKTWQMRYGNNAELPAGMAGVPEPACATDADCVGLGFGDCVDTNSDFVDDTCVRAWQNAGLTPDVIYDVAACNTGDYSCGSAANAQPPEADAGGLYYGMSARMHIDAGTLGTVVIPFLNVGLDTFVIMGDNATPAIGKPLDATIDIESGRCCTEPCVENVTRDECGNDALFGPGLLCPANGGPDCCNCFVNGPDPSCNDGDACTADNCNGCTCVNPDTPPIAAGTCCNTSNNVRTNNDDGDPCTVDGCSIGDDRGVPTHDPAADGEPCDDDNPCTAGDECVTGLCGGENVNGLACTVDADCQFGGDTPGAICDNGLCSCSLAVNTFFGVVPGSKDDPNCFSEGEKITVNVMLGASAVELVGGQFYIDYDPACLQFNSIMPHPNGIWPLELQESINPTAGTIFYALGVNLGGNGTFGGVPVAQMSFTKLGGCSECSLCYLNDNPINTRLTDADGQSVEVDAKCSKTIRQSPSVTIDGPETVKVNVACNSNTREVTWDAPTAASDCEDVELTCQGAHLESGMDMADYIMGGGVFPVGNSNFCCDAGNSCGNSAQHCWTVTVNDETCLDVEIQLSPTMVTKAGGGITRCIKFEVFSNCVQPPLVFEDDMVFGGLFNLIGHFNGNIKIPSQVQPVCITARDQLHTLRGCYMLAADGSDCRADGCIEATFKGDPFFGGNWLVGGNLDGWKKANPNASHDVIDILDFGQLVSQWMEDYGSGDTTCDWPDDQSNADINGDGLVDLLDFSFVSMNFLADSKDCCCPGSASLGNTVGRTSVPVAELKRNGMDDLTVADLNADGVVDLADMQALLQGARPERTAPERAGKGANSVRTFNR
jgi:hypothetical protein